MTRTIAILVLLVGFPVIRAAAVPLRCMIVGQSQNGMVVFPHTTDEIREFVVGVNQIFAQAAITFEIASIGITNFPNVAEIDSADGERLLQLCSAMENTDGLEIYFVPRLVGAAGVYTPEGIVISGEANFRTVAHEIGHAFGWPDIYVERDSTFRTVEGAPSASRLPLDNGFFPAGTMQPDLVRRLLMYGIASDTKGRISRGDVYGLQVLPAEVPGGARVLRFGLVPVGMSGVTNFSPRSL